MKQTVLSLGLVALLAACGGDKDETNPVSGGPTITEEVEITDEEAQVEDVISENLSEDLVAVVFNPATNRLEINIDGLDAPTEGAVYTRNAALDTNGYLGFSTQDDPLDRFFVALGGASDDLTIEALVVADGGQFNRFFGGGVYRRNVPNAVVTEAPVGSDTIGDQIVSDGFLKPKSGLFSYAGKYAAITNIDSDGALLLTLPEGLTPTEIATLAPAQPARIQGDVFLNVNFAEDNINGVIFNREWVDVDTPGADPRLTNVLLAPSPISEEGRFLGETEFPDLTVNGDFGGTFGGTGGTSGTSVAGTTHITDFTDDANNEEEFGVFILNQCGTANASDVCNGTGQ